MGLSVTDDASSDPPWHPPEGVEGVGSAGSTQNRAILASLTVADAGVGGMTEPGIETDSPRPELGAPAHAVTLDLGVGAQPDVASAKRRYHTSHS